MHVGHKLDTKYYVNEQDGKMELSAGHEEKDLGVYFTSDLKPSTQCIRLQQRQEESLQWCAEISRGWTKKTS